MYLKRDGTNMYYRKIGSGPPLVFLHGNGENHTIFEELATVLKRKFTLYLIDSRNHGSSTSVGPYTYHLCAKDVIDFLETLGLKDAALFGFSDGGIIGLMIATTRPRLLSGLIVAGANLSPMGLKKTCLQAIRRDYETYHRPQDALMLNEPNIKKAELMRISTPTLVIAGENDVVHRSHTYSIARHIPNSNLLIIKGHDHYDYILHSTILSDVIVGFFIKTLSLKGHQDHER